MRIGFITILILCVLTCKSQNYRGVKSIQVYEDTCLSESKSVDCEGDVFLTRSFNKDRKVISIESLAFNKTIKLLWDEHEGINVVHFIFDSLSNKDYVYRFDCSQIKPDYKWIENIGQISSIHELEDDSLLKAIMNANKKQLICTRSYNAKRQNISEYYFNDIGDTTYWEFNKYSNEGDLIESRELGEFGNYHYFFNYDSTGNLLSNFRLTENYDTLEAVYRDYNNDNQKILEKYTYEGKISRITKYYYLNNLVFKEETFGENDLLILKVLYSYNNEGLKLTENVLLQKSSENKNIHWVYEYY